LSVVERRVYQEEVFGGREVIREWSAPRLMHGIGSAGGVKCEKDLNSTASVKVKVKESPKYHDSQTV
jgi:hypothetical protein